MNFHKTRVDLFSSFFFSNGILTVNLLPDFDHLVDLKVLTWICGSVCLRVCVCVCVCGCNAAPETPNCYS